MNRGQNNNEESELEKAVRIIQRSFKSQGIPVNKQFDSTLREALDEEGEISKLHLWEQVGPNSTVVMFNILKEVTLFLYYYHYFLWHYYSSKKLNFDFV